MAIGGSKNRKSLIGDESDALFAGLEAALQLTTNHDSIIAAHLSKIVFDPNNSRFGQTELVDQLATIEACLGQYIEITGENSVPDYESLSAKTSAPPLSFSAKKLFNNCASLANTFLPNGGVADQPPKVAPADANGFHVLKTGHRRTIAYHLARPYSGVNSIDILIDKSKTATDLLTKAIGRIAENTARENNTLAEEIHAVGNVLKLMKDCGTEINRVKLSQSTGIERTKLGKIIDIIDSGFAAEQTLINKLHEHGIEDVKSIGQLVKYPSSQWPELVDALIQGGSANFRNEFKDARVKNPPIAVDTENASQLTPDSTTTGGAEKSDDKSIVAQEQTKGGEQTQPPTPTVQKIEVPPAIMPPPTAKETEALQGANVTKAVEPTNAVLPKPESNIRERGAKEILKMLALVDKTIQVNESESALNTLELLINKYGVTE